MNNTLAFRRAIAEATLGEVDWHSEHAGTCQCPGAARHTTPGDTATVFTNGPGTIFCYHQSCSAEVARANEELRQEIHEAEADPIYKYVPTEADRKRWKQRQRDQRLEMRARANLPRIVEQHQLDPEEWPRLSPIQLGADVQNDWRRLLGVLPAWQRVWIGSLTDSGHPTHAAHFREAEDWLRHEGGCPGSHICPAHFAPGVFSRCDDKVVFRQFPTGVFSTTRPLMSRSASG